MCISVIKLAFVVPVNYSILSLVEHQVTVKICSPYPEFVLTDVSSVNKPLKGTEIMFVLTVFY